MCLLSGQLTLPLASLLLNSLEKRHAKNKKSNYNDEKIGQQLYCSIGGNSVPQEILSPGQFFPGKHVWGTDITQEYEPLSGKFVPHHAALLTQCKIAEDSFNTVCQLQPITSKYYNQKRCAWVERPAKFFELDLDSYS